MFTVAIVTVSDRSSRGEREDLSGPEIRKWAEAAGYKVAGEIIVPDEFEDIKSGLIKFVEEKINLILTTGGTGFASRDITPEATMAVIDKIAPGFTEAMRMKSLEITPHAMLSRAVSGISKKSIIINMPGSPKAVRENLQIIEKAITHAIELVTNSVTDCGSN